MYSFVFILLKIIFERLNALSAIAGVRHQEDVVLSESDLYPNNLVSKEVN